MKKHSWSGCDCLIAQHFQRVLEFVADCSNQLRALSPQADRDPEDAMRSGHLDTVREAGLYASPWQFKDCPATRHASPCS